MPDFSGMCPSSHPGCCVARASDCLPKNGLNDSGCAFILVFLCLGWQRASYIDFFFFFFSFDWVLWGCDSATWSITCRLLLLAVTSCANTWGSTIRVWCCSSVLQNVLEHQKYMWLSPAWAQHPLDLLLPLPFRCPARVCVITVHTVAWVMPEEMKGDFSQRSP